VNSFNAVRDFDATRKHANNQLGRNDNDNDYVYVYDYHKR